MFEAKVSWIFLATALLAVAWGIWLKKNEAQEPDREPEWVRHEDKLVERFSNEPYQGVHEVSFTEAPAMIQWEYNYVDGLRQGLATEFFPGPTKKVKMRLNFVDGRRQGPLTTYHLNGVKQSEAAATSGNINGLVTYFDNDGMVDRREVFENSLPSGVAAITAVPELVEQDLPELKPEEADADELQPRLFLDLEGKPYTGTQIGTFFGGAKAFEHSYKDGLPHGMLQGWDPAGNPEYERPRFEGEKHGPWREWATGKFLFSEDHFHHGLRVGTAKRWHVQSAQPRLESQFVHGVEHGIRKIYDKKGNEVRQLHFDHGIRTGGIKNSIPTQSTPLPVGLTATIGASGETDTKVIELDSLPEDFAGLASVDFRYRLSADQAEPPARAARAFRSSVLVNDEVAESAEFIGQLGGWRTYKERIEVGPGARVRLQVVAQPGDLIIHFAGIRLRDASQDDE